MVISLRSVATQFRRLFDIFLIAKSNKVILLQSVTGCYYKVVLLSIIITKVLLSVRDFTVKCVRYYKV